MRAGRVSGRASHLYKKVKTLTEKKRIAEGGRYSELPVFNTLRMYFSPTKCFNAAIFPDEDSLKKFATKLELDLWVFILGCIRRADSKTLRLFAEAVEHFKSKGIGDNHPSAKHILDSYEYLLKRKSRPPTKRELYDHFTDTFEYRNMHLEDFCHRADPLNLKYKKTSKRVRGRRV